MDKLAQWWLTPKFPKKHIENIRAYKPNGLRASLRNFYRTWILHPVKRRLAKYYLIFLKSVFGLKVIGVTGSAGKTTTKEMIVSILKTSGQTVYSYANIDPVYNIPTTILRCKPSTKYLVLEMGIEFPGEMDFYLWMAEPDIGVLTNINATHVEFMGSIEGVAREKGKLVKALNRNGVAVLNSLDNYSKEISKGLRTNIVWYGEGSHISASNISQTSDLNTIFSLNYKENNKIIQIPYLGKHFVHNALAGAAVAISLNLNLYQIKTGLENIEKPDHRMNKIESKKGYLIIDDTYNANPLAVKETISSFKEIKTKGKKIFVFGEMKELGTLANKSHKEIGRQISESDIDYLLCIGDLTKFTINEAIKYGFPKSRSYFGDYNIQIINRVKEIIKKNDSILIKGSRSMKLEEVVEAIK